ncbi:MAG TPA: hypothetical protein VFA78_03720 [Chloroflexota bacterium]|nr:hypothetical protein [Chloroflexota bacterium]
MKPFYLAAGLIALITGTALASAASFHPSAPAAQRTVTLRILPVPGFHARSITILQTGGTATATATATATGTATPTPGTPTATTPPTPTPTATPPPYPDAVTLLQNMSVAFGAVRYVHFLDATDVTPSSGAGVHFNVKARGTATCSGPAYKVNVTAYAKVIGTKRGQNLKYQLIHIKKAYYLKSFQTKYKWQKSPASKTYAFGIPPAANPLYCTSGSGGGSGGGVKRNPPVDLGPQTFNGTKVWHVRMTGSEAYNKKRIPFTLDILITQKGYLLAKEALVINDTVDSQVLKNTYVLSKFNKKVTIKAP